MSTGKYSGPSARYILAGSFLLILYIIFLIVVYYRNTTALQRSSLRQFQFDVSHKAASLEYFLLERKYDIRALADSLEVHTYFINLNMGMSKQYGLLASLFAVQKRMNTIIADKTIGAKAIYKKFALLDENKQSLITSGTFSHRKDDDQFSWESVIDDKDNEPKLVIGHNRNKNELMLIVPCLFKEKIVGWIVARLQQATLYDHFLDPTPSLSGKVFYLTLTDGSIVHPPETNLGVLPWKTLQDIPGCMNHPRHFIVHDAHGHKRDYLMTRVQVHPFSLYLTAFVKADEILGNLKTWQFLVAAAAMILLILIGLCWAIRANIKHLLLTARFDESRKQHHILTAKNRQLKDEINRRQRAEEYLTEHTERYRKLFEFSGDSILLLRDDTIIDCNQKTAELLKLKQEMIPGHRLEDFSHDQQQDSRPAKEIRQRITRAMLSPQNFEWSFQTADKTLLHTEINMSPITLKSGIIVQVLIRDITERKQTQEILVQTEKMMAVGGLAAGMAHEINNPLGVILQATQNIVRRLGTDLKKNHTIARSLDVNLEKMQNYLDRRTVYSYLNSIQAAGERAAKIVRTMLEFGRSSKTAEKEFCDIDTILEDALTLAASDYDLKKTYDFKKITINRDYGNPGKVYCARTEIEQVFFNIIKNAAQAMATNGENGNNQALHVRTGCTGNNVFITITDNGPGISKTMQKSIFERTIFYHKTRRRRNRPWFVGFLFYHHFPPQWQHQRRLDPGCRNHLYHHPAGWDKQRKGILKPWLVLAAITATAGGEDTDTVTRTS
ncbi:MAG TPA: PAS domain S-box protein [Desulfobulbus sp.]|nr:PAS domain S-box protein [Desulfobulbus sp.]